MTVYTGRGDAGETDLRGGDRIAKTDARIEAYGTVDELNALIGTVRPTGHDDLDDWLRDVQNRLHVVQAQLASTESVEPAIGPEDVAAIEDWIDGIDDELEPLSAFILPGGGEVGAGLHHARAVCRRAERRVVALAAAEAVPDAVSTYLNRLSDALFVAARVANAREGVAEANPTY